jgi:hypothetical protein
VYFMRFAEDGTAVIPPVLVSDLTERSSMPRIVWTGSDYGVAWRVYNTMGVNEGFRFVKISETGEHLSIVEEFGNPSPFVRPVEIAWSGHEFGVVWTDSVDGNDNINFMTFGSSGVRVGDRVSIKELTGITIVNWLSIEWTGTEYFVTWTDRSTGLDQGYAQFISSSGTLSGDLIQATDSPESVSAYSASSNGLNFGFVFSEPGPSLGNYYIYFAEMNRDGDFLDAPLLLVENTVRSPFMIRATGDGYFIAWGVYLEFWHGGIGFAHLESSATTAPSAQVFQPDSYGYPNTLSSVMTAEGHFALVYEIARRTNGYDIGFTQIGGCW